MITIEWPLSGVILLVIGILIWKIMGIDWSSNQVSDSRNSKLQLGYRCNLTITERTEITNLLKMEIKRLTNVVKTRSNKDTVWSFKMISRFNKRKRRLAKIYSKMEHLW
jgi:hypothetical protein